MPRTPLLALFLVFLASGFAQEQPAARVVVQGRMADAEGVGVPYASVQLGGTTAGAGTDSTGRFRFAAMRSVRPSSGGKRACSGTKRRCWGRVPAVPMEHAKELAPQNPRVVLLDAVGLYNKPALFGGDKEAALESFERAARLAAQETHADPLAPHWGRAEALAWAGKAHLDTDRPDEARAAFQHALRVNPDFGWVRSVLLPQVTGDASGGASSDARP